MGNKKSFLADLMARLAAVKPLRWLRFGIVSVIFFLWVIWLNNPWVALAWLLLIDIYITGYIPWTWWKKQPKSVRGVMAWVDAIVYALVLVYFIFAFVGQNYNIPTSSLEKSLLVGDYLWVNKTIYGPRVPMTPVHFPLSHNTLPVVGTKSYFEKPSLNYHRLQGIRGVERGDIVVFNYPQGDTVTLKISSPDYYQICYELRSKGVDNPKEYIASHKELFGDIVWRPVDRRENYVKRAIGLPGERLAIRNDIVYIDGKPISEPDNVQFNYIIPVNRPIDMERWQDLGVRMEDLGASPIVNQYISYQYYDVPLTSEMKKEVEKWSEVAGPLVREGQSGLYDLGGVFPLGMQKGWTRTDMGEFWIPKRGATLHLTLDNLPIYRRAISTYEGNAVDVRDGKIYINDKQTDYYTFKMDYYWMMGDNRDRSLDSRYWGFVPEDHIVGSPMFVIVSIDEERSLFDSKKIRWNRVLRDANPDKSKGTKQW
jgi:signal peptidase I